MVRPILRFGVYLALVSVFLVCIRFFSRSTLSEALNSTLPLPLPHTSVLAHAPGFTLFRNLYLFDGTMYIVLEDGGSLPIQPLERVLTKVGHMRPGEQRQLRGDEIRYINMTAAIALFRRLPITLDGSTIILYDTDQFTTHYYHWWAEVIAGAWRLWSAHCLTSPSDASHPFPSRFLLPNINGDRWLDPAKLNAPLTIAAFPWAPVETSTKWELLKSLNKPLILTTVAVLDRGSTNENFKGNMWGKTLGSVLDLPVGLDHWRTLRERVLKNLVGTIPRRPEIPNVLYISRQNWGRRSLDTISNARLIEGMRALEQEGVCTFTYAEMDKFTVEKQVALAYNATVILGVHGNGLTHQIWMPPTPKSLVLEIFSPQHFAYDFYATAVTVGHNHFGIWFDEEVDMNVLSLSYWPNLGPRFHAPDISVDGTFVANLIRRHLLE
ncbi:hypothetical protein M427DRAFT_109455 [Gonapodya prolifera JEL478]|uniref:Glycosyltransferase 61 catalytic domain-containing protein n=1 Tax=Gonapodya prolifera (strain JEL478) TaxID=1344416 RepID=A0A139APH8_GONPJ|nr:hypothetical protein M427DRAFT_109455 [Gonapodya prolifera JEL478]|eukprot:KXS18646.1 hypothetical protein M427DRAFT_109455 [Gonapodya prolifera JEL478]